MEYKVNFKPRYGHGKHAHDLLYKIINDQRNEYVQMLNFSLQYKDKIHLIKKKEDETDLVNPTWNNGFLPGLDIIGIYSMLCKFKPAHYIEIGSGNSTKVAYKAKLENELTTKIVSIDPEPRDEIDKIANTIIRQPFEDIDFNFILDLEENDILFIDNSHRVLPNSDSLVFFLEILPKLKKGVIVHVHDIYLPYDYPQEMCDRFYSEQYGLAFFLLANPAKYVPIQANYFISEDAELAKIISPIWEHPNLSEVERHGGSFWFKIG